MGRQKAPEQLLDVAALSFLLGEHRNTIRKRFDPPKSGKPAGEWHADGFLVGKELKLPVSAYNRWLDGKRLQQPEKEG